MRGFKAIIFVFAAFSAAFAVTSSSAFAGQPATSTPATSTTPVITTSAVSNSAQIEIKQEAIEPEIKQIAPEDVIAEAGATQETAEDSGHVEAGFLGLLFSRFNTEAKQAVERQLSLFSEKIKKRFAVYLSRSGKYLEMMQSILTEKGMPEELAFLPLVESGFSLHAKSPMKAVGPWQFIASTGKLYGLKINWWVDERKDPVKSTEAAAAYLGNLYDMFGSWSLALAAYNAGEGRVMRALKRAKGDDYWDLIGTRHLKRETKEYVPKFIAAGMIAADPTGFGFDTIQYEENFDFDEVTIKGPLSIDSIAKAAGVPAEDIRELNPELIRWCTPPDQKDYTLRIPLGTHEAFVANMPASDGDGKCVVLTYKVKKGDTLKSVAKKTGVDQKTIISLNSINKRRGIKPGQVLYLPPKES